jgi:DNA-binding transcriptional MerR regulator
VTEFRVDELARKAETSVRNVRVYQERGLLPPPKRVGRNGIYNDAHLRRLRLIRALLNRGYTFATISELLDAWSSGQDLSDIFGFDTALAAPWSDEEPTHHDETSLSAEVGTFDAEDLEKAVRLGLISYDSTGLKVLSPRLLDAGRQLVEAGVPLTVVLGLAENLKVHLDAVARLIFEMFDEHIVRKEPESEEITATLIQLRPLAKLAVDALLSLALTQQSTATLTARADRRAEERPEQHKGDPADERHGPAASPSKTRDDQTS